jgi:[CysO sulfur-carrier protein]-S-L-cysteine hydrolase
VRIRRTFLEEIIQQARDEYPNECCGILAMSHGEAARVFPAENMHRSPTRFEIDGRDVMRIQDEIDNEGWQLGSLYHSHTKTAAYPSQTDVNFAANWPGMIWLIVSLENFEEPSVRAFEIADGGISERPLSIDE